MPAYCPVAPRIRVSCFGGHNVQSLRAERWTKGWSVVLVGASSDAFKERLLHPHSASEQRRPLPFLVSHTGGSARVRKECTALVAEPAWLYVMLCGLEDYELCPGSTLYKVVARGPLCVRKTSNFKGQGGSPPGGFIRTPLTLACAE